MDIKMKVRILRKLLGKKFAEFHEAPADPYPEFARGFNPYAAMAEEIERAALQLQISWGEIDMHFGWLCDLEYAQRLEADAGLKNCPPPAFDDWQILHDFLKGQI